jgi:hypothetical protein
MWSSSYLRGGKRAGADKPQRMPGCARQRATYRPRIEALEDRSLLSTLTVLNTLDSGPGSLRADIAAAKKGDTIVFAPSLAGQQVLLTSGQLYINKDLTIQGLSNLPQISGGGLNGSRVFEIAANTQVSLINLAILNGNSLSSPLNGASTTGDFPQGYGGGILNFGTLSLSGCTLTGNAALLDGGAIANFGTLTVSRCTLTGNSGNDGGGIANETGATLTVNNSTLTGNSAGNAGGGIYNNAGTATINYSVAINNVAPTGADLFTIGKVTLKKSTIGVIAP